MKRMTLPMLLIAAAMLALTACASKRDATPAVRWQNDGTGGGMM